MTSAEFSARIRRLYESESGNKAIVLDMSGEINSFVGEKFVEAYSRAEESSTGIIVLNFTEVSYINSTGIALIIGLLGRARKSHQQLRVFGLNDHYMEVFHITRLADFVQIYPDENSALEGAFQSSKV